MRVSFEPCCIEVLILLTENLGYAYHADFIMGWDRNFLQQAVETCTNPSGRIEDCALFNVVDQATATSCKLDNPLPKSLLGEIENILGPMASLPGNVAIFGDDGNPDQPEVPSSTTSKPSLTYAPGSAPSNPASPLPGQVFKALGSDTSSAPAPTLPSAPVAAAAAVTETPTTTAQPSYYSTQFITNGNTVSEILWEELIVTVTETVESPAETASYAKKRRSHLHGHARRS